LPSIAARIVAVDLIIFDLDGTLVDSRLDIANSVNEVLQRMDRQRLPEKKVYEFIGHGVRNLLERSLGNAPDKEVDLSVEMFLQSYGRHLLDNTRLYPGTREALEVLRPGRTLSVLTNKPLAESIALLEGLELRSYFQFIYGGESFPRRKPDPMGAEALIEKAGADRDRVLMVGDSRVDYDTARNASIHICLVSYGFGAEEIGALAPDYVVDDLRQLIPIVENTSTPNSV
jgi:phosphoglycolate phosphatase